MAMNPLGVEITDEQRKARFQSMLARASKGIDRANKRRIVESKIFPENDKSYFEIYNGRNTEQMPKLRADGRVPANVSQIMQRRLDIRNSDAKVKGSYMDNHFDTGDAVFYHPYGRVKIVLDSQHLRDMTPDTLRRSGALIIGEEVYKALEGEEFKKGKLGKTVDWMSREDVKAHPVWKVLARDQGLLNDYADYIFAEGKERFGYDIGMRVFLGSANGDTPEMRAWCVCRLGNGSDASGRYDLDLGSGRFVGIVPEAQKYLDARRGN